MSKEIRLCVPITTQGKRLEKDVELLGGPDVRVTVQTIDKGPTSIESFYDEALAVPDLLRIASQAERDGADAVVVDCMGDPGLDALRERLSIPVFGPAQTTMHMALTIGRRFSVVTVLERLHPLIEGLAMRYSVRDAMAPPRSVDIPVLELDDDRDRLCRALVRESIAAVREDGADVLIFGCTGMYGIRERIEQGLQEAGLAGVPVLDPIPVTVEVVAALLRQGLSHSKHGFPFPPKDCRPGCGLET